MNTPSSVSNSLRTKLLALMVLRVVLAIGFLGIASWFQITGGSFIQPAYYPLHAIVISVGLLTIAYAALIRRVTTYIRLFALFQISVDIVLITIIVFVTGGVQSYLSIMYFFSVIGGSILLEKKGGFYAAFLSSVTYGIILEMDFYHMLPDKYKVLWSPVVPVWEDVLTITATHVLGFFTVAYLTGYLAEKTARIERELEEKGIDFERLETLNRHIVENISSGIMTLDSASRITSFNRGAEAITGYSLKDVYYRDLNGIFPGLVFRDFKGFGPGREPLSLEEVFMRSDGEEICLGFTISEGKGEEMDRIVIFRDLTKVKAMEEQLRRDEKLKALGEVSASIAHEVRNPLASISGSIQVLKEDLALDGDKRHLMDIVIREAGRLDTLITDFLLFAKPARDKRERVNVCEVIRETLKVFANSPEARELEIKDLSRGEILIEADRRQISQVFWNLFLNAANSMGEHLEDRRLVIKAVEMERADDETGESSRFGLITVADTGSGIAEKDLGKIFDPFFSTRSTGTGLGLSLVYRIIESHGGSIEVESTEGKGSEFKITLPVFTGAGMKAASDG